MGVFYGAKGVTGLLQTFFDEGSRDCENLEKIHELTLRPLLRQIQWRESGNTRFVSLIANSGGEDWSRLTLSDGW